MDGMNQYPIATTKSGYNSLKKYIVWNKSDFSDALDLQMCLMNNHC